jgi:hypothetical protein
MGLKDALDEIGAGQAIRAKILPRTPKIAKVAAILEERMSRLAEPLPFDLDALQAKLLRVADTGDWAPISERDLRNTCFCLWRTTPPLAGDLRFLERYFGALRSAASRIATKFLIRTYFMHFDPSAPGLREVAQYLGETVAAWPWDWAAHHRNYRLFDPLEAPRRIADAALAHGRPRKFLETLGLKGQLGSSPFSAACFRAATVMVGRRLEDGPEVAVASILTEWATLEDRRLAFYGERNELAKALLLPWERADPPDDLRAHLTQFFVETYKDPRLSPLAWEEVNVIAKNVMLRWLAKGSLEQFLQVVDKTAPGHQWDYRRAFWAAYIDGQFVRDAWVAFGAMGQAYATRLAQDTSDRNMSRFGRLNRSHEGTQAVLLLRIGDLVIGDWSHNGALRIWRSDNPAAPSFYRRDYEAAELRRNSDFSRVHSYPPGAWQADTAQFIRRHTRIRIEPRDYMPKRRKP